MSCIDGPLLDEEIGGACFIVDEVEVVDVNSAQFLFDLKHKEPSDEGEEGEVEESKGHYTDNHGPISG